MKTNKRQLGSRIEERGASFLLGYSSFPRTSHLTPSTSPRRGILLLVVLSLLTLFLLIGTAFIVSANQYRRAQKIQAKLTETSNSSIDQSNLLNEVINQLVRDTNNQNSTLRFHSLLRDMYGNDGLMGEVSNADWADVLVGGTGNPTGGQMIQFSLNNVTDQFGIPFSPTTKQLSQIDNAYNGLVLTFLDGPARGHSTRITGFLAIKPGPPPITVPVFRVMSPRKADGSNIVAADFADLNASRILINGRPFNGTGVGYNVTAAANSARLSAGEALLSSDDPSDPNTYFPIALMPNGAFFNPQNVRPADYLGGTNPAGATQLDVWNNLNANQQRLLNGFNFGGQGGSDESYDAVDFQNMVLALLQTNPIETMLPGQPSTWPARLPGSLGNTVLPSLQRPALLRFWQQQLVTAGGTLLEDEPNLLRKVLLRPNWLDHPSFTGSNPDFDGLTDPQKLTRMIYGPWDVDNDNDGIRDSVWVDFGAPVMENADGRLVKPLAAIMVLDMDGRLNLNAHGSEDIANPVNFNALDGVLAGGNDTDNLPQGQGYGPAEISLGPVLGIGRFPGFLDGLDPNNIAAIDPTNVDARDIAARLSRLRRGKYGMGTASAPGRSGVYNEAYDLVAQVKMQGVPKWADGRIVIDSTGTLGLGGYATPPDLRGRYALGLNDFGQPVYEALADGTWMNADSPYEVDLSLGGSRGESDTADDGVYSMAEMERILRAFDPDAGTLPSRIWELAGEFKPTAAATTPNLDDLNLWRTTLTTDTYDLPVPSVVVPGWMRLGPDGVVSNDDFVAVMDRPAVGLSFADLLEYRIRVGMGILNPVTFAALPANDPQKILFQSQMAKLLPRDLADGLRLDINRPFGNGRDDNDNGVVDEPGEIEGTGDQEAVFWASSDPRLAAFTNQNTGAFRDDLDRDGDGDIDPWERGDTTGDGNLDSDDDLVALHNFRRQMLARDLYVLALTLVDPFDLTTTAGKAKTRQLAQWAINVVDFRDPDNIMTAFEYDANPFDGWGADGNLSSDNDIAGPDTQVGTNDDVGGVVWGAERPELLMTETLAWHDRRTRDTANELLSTANASQDEIGLVTSGKDQDFDQRAPPRGFGFIEIYCPWPENPATNEDTHVVDNSGNDLGVDLTAVDEITGNSPCWRMVVYKKGGVNRNPDEIDDDNRPLDMHLNFLADRSIYFTDFDPGVSNPMWDNFGDGVAFFHDSTNNPVNPVRPGGYMVVGAGVETANGSGIYEAIFGKNIIAGVERGVTLDTNTNTVKMVSTSGTTVQDKDGFSLSSRADIAIIDRTSAGSRRFSFSEPAQGYPILSSVRDIPFDDERAIYKDPRVFVGTELNDGENRLMMPEGSPQASRTIPGFSWIYLQRLANPLLPWNPEPGKLGHSSGLAVNPYRSVDSMGVNVTTFNGQEPSELRWANGADRSLNAGWETFGDLRTIASFSSLQRGRSNDPTDPGVDLLGTSGLQASARATIPRTYSDPAIEANLWNPEALGTVGANLSAGYWRNRAGVDGNGTDPNDINDARHPSNISINPALLAEKVYNFGGIPDCTLGFLNEPFRAAGSDPNELSQPFPWLTWNNRPFANANELMQVPAYRSSQLLRAFSFRNTPSSQLEKYNESVTEINYSDTSTPNNPNPPKLILKTDGPYGHLLNFFRTSNTDNSGSTLTADKSGIAGMYRLLDYVHVPSPFVKTETWLSPASFGNSNVTGVNDPRYQRQPPFNRIAEYREPGRVNINTVVNEAVYSGLMHKDGIEVISPSATGQVHPGPTWENLNISRRGYTGGNFLLQLDSSIPTFFANPFRSADAADLVPRPNMLRTGVDCTMQRSEGSTAGANAKAIDDPLFAAATTNPYNNADRNPYFRYQPMTRLSSMTTTRSNVYAVWVTIGFFEVEKAPDWLANDPFPTPTGNVPVRTVFPTQALYDRVYPEGYMLAKEAGSDTGDIRRVREFAMIDRTVPVAFEPGENHNVDKAIRLRRRIE